MRRCTQMQGLLSRSLRVILKFFSLPKLLLLSCITQTSSVPPALALLMAVGFNRSPVLILPSEAWDQYQVTTSFIET
jgi:hypothetical protein